MTTHKNTHEQQYRHAPLNGLIIGAIIGVAWVLVLLIPVCSRMTLRGERKWILSH